MVQEIDIFELRQNWIQFKMYDNPDVTRNWRDSLDWYYNVLRTIVRPIVESDESVSFVLFTRYGPQQYESSERPAMERLLPSVPTGTVSFVRLRVLPAPDSRERVKRSFEEQIHAQPSALWDYEIVREYDVIGDLGNRYGRGEDGSVDQGRTLRFIRYWDAGCRYILSIVADSGNWERNVDIWGVPHLINNALGSWLRHPNAACDLCGTKLCVDTNRAELTAAQSVNHVPLMLAACPRCDRQMLIATNM